MSKKKASRLQKLASELAEARAKKLTPERRREITKRAAEARWTKQKGKKSGPPAP